jgi:16S rRNA U1498 N3-methylase RsmE
VSSARRTVGLGTGILRADTAAVVAATLLVAHPRR